MWLFSRKYKLPKIIQEYEEYVKRPKAEIGKWSEVKVKVIRLCLTLCGHIQSMDCTVHGILQARILEWVAYPFSRSSSWPRNQIGVSCIADRLFVVIYIILYIICHILFIHSSINGHLGCFHVLTDYCK